VVIKTVTFADFFIPYSRILFDKVIGSQPDKKFPALYGTRKFITAFVKAGHLYLS
jgi:hypothetical protein